jgi:hypothetical protein
MHARIMCDTGGAGLCASRCICLDVHGVCACVGVFLFASHYCSIVRGYRAMRSVSTREAAPAAAAPARMPCVPPQCGGALRPRRLLRLNGSFSFAAVVPSWRCRSIVSVSAPIRMRAAAPHVRWRVPPAFVFCYSFTRRFRGFIRRIRLIICACSCHVAPAGAF